MFSNILKKNLLRYQFSQYDITVIGAGPGGYVSAIKAGQLGFKTALIESRATETLGGTCLNEGCIPAKALLNMTHKLHDAQHHFSKFGINVGEVTVDFDKMQQEKAKTVTSLTKGVAMLCKKNKVDVYYGRGSFKDQNTLLVQGKDNTEISTKNVIIATGSEPTPFPGIEFDEKIIVSSTGSMDSEKIPETLYVIGGGVIGLELGSVYNRLGSKVTVIEFEDICCKNFCDHETAKKFQSLIAKQGITIKAGHKLLGAKVVNGKAEIEFQPVKGGDVITATCDQLLISTGRRPYTSGLNAEGIGIQFDKYNRVETDHNLRTNIPNIYAIGDCVKGSMLAHKSEEEGIYVVEYLKHGHGHVDYNCIPGVIYTHPEVAWVGKSEEQLKAEGVEYNKGTFIMGANSRAKANMDTDGFVKVLSCKQTDKILGAWLVCSTAGELVQEIVLAMQYGGSSEDVARTCHAHPTLSEAVKEAMLAVYDKPIHM